MNCDNWIAISEIIVNIILAVWVVTVINNNAANKRVLKDYFIEEIKSIRDEYTKFFEKIEQIKPKDFAPWFKLMAIKLNNLSFLLNDKYNISNEIFDPYKIHLNTLITNNIDFTRHYRGNTLIVFSEPSKYELIKFRQDYYYLFNNLIIEINDK